MAIQRLKDAAEDAKKKLSTTLETQISLPFITMNSPYIFLYHLKNLRKNYKHTYQPLIPQKLIF